MSAVAANKTTNTALPRQLGRFESIDILGIVFIFMAARVMTSLISP
ncbi:MAG: hypothetical protein ACI85N_000726 [Gammaproteobacteria bacterium]|jgi:hypothetical protein